MRPSRLSMTTTEPIPGRRAAFIDSYLYPGLADLIGNPRALEELERMGLEDVRFWQAVIIGKPPGGPRLYWHQDCIMWQDPRAYSDMPPMIFLYVLLRRHIPGERLSVAASRNASEAARAPRHGHGAYR